MPINFRSLKPKHLTPEGYAEFADMWREAIQAINANQGVNGPAVMLNDLNMNGNNIVNLGTPAKGNTSSALSQATADPMYSTSVQQAAMESVGTKMLQTTRRLNDGTQQHQISSDLNTQGSVPPSNITGTIPYTTVAGSSITFTWAGVYIQLADLSYVSIADGTLTVTGLANTVYSVYPYYDTKLGILSFVAITGSGTGAPPIAFASPNTQAAQQQNADGRIPLTGSPTGTVTINGNPASLGLRSR
jgi:hypothetical protein